MKVRIYRTADNKFRLLITEKGLAVGTSTILDTQLQALTLALEFADSTLTVSEIDGLFTTSFTSTSGSVSFVRFSTADQVNALLATGKQVFEGIRNGFEAAMTASATRLTNRANGAIKRFKRSVVGMDKVASGTVSCELKHVPSGTVAMITETSDDTALAQAIAAAGLPE
jgi:hypothetical protein